MVSERIKILYSLDQMQDVVKKLRQYIKHSAVMALTGSLGAGKTTLVHHFLRSYGITQEISSPTFTYVNIYSTHAGFTFYHFDLYRIASVDEFLQAGFDEYLYQPNSLALIEWPEVIEPLLTHAVCHVVLAYADDLEESRIMNIELQV